MAWGGPTGCDPRFAGPLRLFSYPGAEKFLILFIGETEGGIFSVIEVVFSQSACGSLKVAQRYGTGKCPDGAIGFIFAEREEGPKPSKKQKHALAKNGKGRSRLEGTQRMYMASMSHGV